MSTHAPLLLVVCTGNICRSPMAQAILADEARRNDVSARVASAGLAAQEGNAATELTLDAMNEIGLDLAAHRSRPLTREMIVQAALVLTATRRQRDDLRRFFPGDVAKIISFDDATGLGDLQDPYGGSRQDFRKIRDLLRKGAASILSALRRSTAASKGNLPPRS